MGCSGIKYFSIQMLLLETSRLTAVCRVESRVCGRVAPALLAPSRASRMSLRSLSNAGIDAPSGGGEQASPSLEVQRRCEQSRCDPATYSAFDAADCCQPESFEQ